MEPAISRRQRLAIDVGVVVVPMLVMAVRPDLIRRSEWTLRPLDRFARRLAFSTLVGFAVATWGAHVTAEALERFAREHGREPTPHERDELMRSLPPNRTRHRRSAQ